MSEARTVVDLQARVAVLEAALRHALAVLEEASEVLDRYADAIDGPEGTMQPNAAMHAQGECDHLIANVIPAALAPQPEQQRRSDEALDLRTGDFDAHYTAEDDSSSDAALD